MSIFEKNFGSEDLDVEVEYQTDTVGIYGISEKNGTFMLTAKHTDCLAKETCGIPAMENLLITTETSSACCTPGGGCC